MSDATGDRHKGNSTEPDTRRIRRRRHTVHGDRTSDPPVTQPPKHSTLPGTGTCLQDQETASEEVLASCTPCTENKIDKESRAYCATCVQFLCAKCLRHHKHHKLLSGHHMPTTLTVDKCRREKHKCTHHGEVIQMYCKDHCYLCCNICLNTNHTNCTIQDLDKMIATANVEKLKTSSLTLLKQQLKGLAGSRKRLKERKTVLTSERDKQIEEIRQVAAELTAMLKELERASLYELQTKIGREIKSIDKNLEEYKICMKGICDDIKLIGEPREETREIKIMNMKVCEFRARYTYSNMLEKAQHAETVAKHVEFMPDVRILYSIKTAHSLGMVSVNGATKTTLRLISRHSAQIDEDPTASETTCITAIESLNDGRLLLADEDNNKIKLFDDCFHLLKSVTLSSSPRGLSVNTYFKCAVTLPKEGSVQLFDIVGDDICSSKTIHLNLEFTAVVAMKDGMVLCCNGNADSPVLHVDFDGNILNKYRINGYECTQPNYLYLSADLSMLYVTDAAQGIYCLEFGKGQAGMWHYTRPDIKCPLGITVDLLGRIFTVDFETNSIYRIHLGRRTTIETLSHPDFDILRPQCLRYLPDNDEFLLSLDGSYEVLRFKLDE